MPAKAAPAKAASTAAPTKAAPATETDEDEDADADGTWPTRPRRTPQRRREEGQPPRRPQGRAAVAEEETE